PYGCRPYEAAAYPKELGPSHYLQEDGYIFVYQDVRGRWMSEGEYTNMTPHIPNKTSNNQVDESTDTYDTIDWLINNVRNHNGKVGQWGISYPGFYTTAGAIDAHPAMKASSPQAPIADFYFDDFHHRGAYFLSYFAATEVFGHQTEPTTQTWYDRLEPGTKDAYRFFLEMGSLANGDQYLPNNFFWEELSKHPNYDAFWQARNILPHLKNIDHAVMTVGGWFDAEDLYGPLHTYGTIEKNNPNTYNTIVMGPWSHGDWARDKVHQLVGNIHFGDYISDFYQKEIERNFFNHFLKDGPQGNLPEAYMFDTGAKEWNTFDAWPPKAEDLILYPQADGQLLEATPEDAPSRFVSDPMKPVPYTEDIEWRFTPRPYMTGDQRFASRRPDVLSYESEPLEADLTIAGPIMAELWVSTDQGDADWVV
ncbi:MAG: CocE/NonD family hydrolase, partial [Bacteroidota bacterium]